MEDAFPLATQVAVIDKGALLCAGTPTEVGTALKTAGHRMFLAMPAAMCIWTTSERETAPCPITVRDGKDWLEGFVGCPLPTPRKYIYPDETAIQAEEPWFRYEQDLPDVVKGLSFKVQKGKFLALLGGNGAGKTSALRLLSGQRKPYRGTVQLNGSVGLLHPV
ncbi:MAG: ATP-binding cassette domain-containing protein [Oscillibacter sp.]|nr:ATP-binding cassette domain-containing protein [Oscillibacter sp.]